MTRLDGLEPDNLLAFLALLGLLRALEAADEEVIPDLRLYARAAWTLEAPPLRPCLLLARPLERTEIAEAAASGLARLAVAHDFAGRKDLNQTRQECRSLLQAEASAARRDSRVKADLLAALVNDAAVKDTGVVDPTPLCLLFGQGHQHFLDRLASVPGQQAPPKRGRGKAAVEVSAARCLEEALFEPWHRTDPTFSFRWDPEEDVRYALQAGDPTDAAYKSGTQHGANRLAAVGLGALTVVPEARRGRVRPTIPGGQLGPEGFSFAWPIWSEPARLASIRALLGHPDLRTPGGMAMNGVDHVLVAKRISVGKFFNFTRARPLGP